MLKLGLNRLRVIVVGFYPTGEAWVVNKKVKPLDGFILVRGKDKCKYYFPVPDSTVHSTLAFTTSSTKPLTPVESTLTKPSDLVALLDTRFLRALARQSKSILGSSFSLPSWLRKPDKYVELPSKESIYLSSIGLNPKQIKKVLKKIKGRKDGVLPH